MNDTVQETQEERDRKWRESLPTALRSVAERHGRKLFTFAYNIGAINEALGVINRRMGGSNEIRRAMKFISEASNIMTHELLVYHQTDIKKIAEIQMDIKRAVDLGMGNVEQEKKIIIAH